ncbi:MAG: DNA repair protein RadC [Lachnospiraceae bacterium]|nr:DNA repair protein RadC [Lachnospiraceae bacterium]
MNKINTNQLPSWEQPYEKCEKYGVTALSDVDLLAVIIRNGTRELNSIDLARKLLNSHPIHKGLLGLSRLSLEELMGIKGIGKVKAIQILCILELSKRLSKQNFETFPTLDSPKSIADYFMEEMRHLEREVIVLLVFNGKHRLIKSIPISQGTVNSSITTPREILTLALRHEAVYIVLLHNHPSGDATESTSDLKFTKDIHNACKLIGIELSDHIIIGDHCYTSLKEKGYL